MEALALLGRMAVVFALLAAVLVVLKRSERLRGRAAGGALQVVSSTRISKAAGLTVVRVDDRHLVLGVTAQGVTVLTELSAAPSAAVAGVPAGAVAAAPAPVGEPAAASSTPFASLLAAQLAGAPAASASPAPAALQPPTVAAFLADVWRSVRRRPIESTEVSAVAVAAALAAASTADTAPAPAPAAAADTPLTTAADGPAAPRAVAARRAAHRTDAQQLQERPWNRACRTASRNAGRDAALV